MITLVTHLNYVHVLVVAVAGFVLGCLWSHGPLFGKLWMKEMKFTQETMEAALKRQGMAQFLVKGLVFTLLSTFGLAVILPALHAPSWRHGVVLGAFLGLFGPGVRLLNGALWDNRSLKLQMIDLSHEVVVYAAQGALLAAWH